MITSSRYTVAALLTLVMLCTTAFVPADLPDGVKVGDAAPSFLLKNVDGLLVGQQSFPNAKGMIVVFTCNHCPYAVKYEDRVQQLHTMYAEKGFPVVAINPNDPAVSPDDSYDKMKERAREKQFTFPYVFDATQDVAKAYGARRTPHVFVLQRTAKGGYTVEYIGAIDDNPDDAGAVDTRFVEQAVNNLLENKKPATNFTKAIGCTIKWKKS